jgi:hypothetical protein
MSQPRRGAVVDSPDELDETTENQRATADREQVTPTPVGNGAGARGSHSRDGHHSIFQRSD